MVSAVAEPTPPRNPAPALVASVVFGLIGLVLLLIGAVADSNPVLIAGAGAGVLSLIAALVWRSQLIDAWRRKQNP
jgi:hypothetical protein